MSYYVHQAKCIGCRKCIDTCADAFGINDDGKSDVIINGISSGISKAFHTAMRNCPGKAIKRM